jgi:nucleoside-diphosphate-sugar epimerase
MDLPRLVVTGASGFLGRHLLEALKGRYRILAIARRSQQECGAPIHDSITWYQVDIGEGEPLDAVFRDIEGGGGAEVVIHLAAHYDFTGEDHPEYWRTNVHGLRNMLDRCRHLHLRRFVFASSVAACRFPPPGGVLNESSPPDGDHIYAKTKRIGEAMLGEYRDSIPSCIVRFGAMFSDWCEYPPLYVFLQTWLSKAWNARILAGKGASAVPYLHVREGASFLLALLERHRILNPGEILIASTNGAVNHVELYEEACAAYFGRKVKPIFLPRWICWPGLYVRDLAGRLLGERPFERPWMGRYIDLALTVDASHTFERIGWRPKERLEILRRMPFLIENLKSNPGEWAARNRAAMKEVRVRANLRVHRLMELHEEEIMEALVQVFQGPRAKQWLLGYRRLETEDLRWYLRQLMRHLMNAVRTRERSTFLGYCRDLAERRFSQGFSVQEVCEALSSTNEVIVRVLGRDPLCQGLEMCLYNHVTMTLRLGIDEVEDTYEALSGTCPVPRHVN